MSADTDQQSRSVMTVTKTRTRTTENSGRKTTEMDQEENIGGGDFSDLEKLLNDYNDVKNSSGGVSPQPIGQSPSPAQGHHAVTTTTKITTSNNKSDRPTVESLLGELDECVETKQQQQASPTEPAVAPVKEVSAVDELDDLMATLDSLPKDGKPKTIRITTTTTTTTRRNVNRDGTTVEGSSPVPIASDTKQTTTILPPAEVVALGGIVDHQGRETRPSPSPLPPPTSSTSPPALQEPVRSKATPSPSYQEPPIETETHVVRNHGGLDIHLTAPKAVPEDSSIGNYASLSRVTKTTTTKSSTTKTGKENISQQPPVQNAPLNTTADNNNEENVEELDVILKNLKNQAKEQGINTIPKGDCAQCDCGIIGEVIIALGKMWHPQHFTCANCQTELGHQNFYERDGLAYCETDYHNLFSPRCASCSEAIRDKCMTAMDKTWHPEHFVCAQCGCQFGEDGFHERDGKPYCPKDFFAHFAPKCGACSKPIQNAFINALNAHWHPECFVCHDCKKPFMGGPFFVHNNLPYCEAHFHEKRGNLCAACNKPILGRLIAAMGQKFHPEHFVCHYCLCQLNKGTFKEEEAKPYCHVCFEKLFS